MQWADPQNEILNRSSWVLLQSKKYTHLTHYLNSTEGDLKMAATRPLNGTPGPVTLSTVEVKESKQMEPFQ